ncbi:hypothetical protein CC78DRAFT_540644 [Lojkania enalia]|uniref:F-box domain-containing protein n=1 Tax=Lojkania enalia TaxID=147567 RepID=A0A9P4KHH1_9PLEO|nr:hypothetical protein CC78DRAFT_540644 [Didymosphaeria enalia]
MSASVHNANMETSPERGACSLFNLPMELQLAIYEMVVIENKVLLLNCPCNSSFRNRWKERVIEEEMWEDGTIRPPEQPALTRTCRLIRLASLPIFYKQNIFRAHYCQSTVTDLNFLIRWLRTIGKENRELLRQMYFYDRNESQDLQSSKMLEKLKNCEIFSEMGGTMETLSSQYCCAHLIKFGKWERKESEVPVALEPGVPKLRIAGEL